MNTEEKQDTIVLEMIEKRINGTTQAMFERETDIARLELAIEKARVELQELKETMTELLRGVCKIKK